VEKRAASAAAEAAAETDAETAIAEKAADEKATIQKDNASHQLSMREDSNSACNKIIDAHIASPLSTAPTKMLRFDAPTFPVPITAAKKAAAETAVAPETAVAETAIAETAVAETAVAGTDVANSPVSHTDTPVKSAGVRRGGAPPPTRGGVPGQAESPLPSKTN